MSVLIVTSLGDVVVDLFTDRCPLTCKNFLKLCKIKYYNGCLFHTIQKDYTAQTGDPTGTGSGGDSVYKFLFGEQARFFGDEIHLDVKHSKVGTLAMASAGENLNASQFYFTLRDDLDYLDGKHTVFGEVAEGLDTLTRMNEAYIDEKNRPYKNIRIKHTYILDDPFDDPPQLSDLIPGASPEGRPKDEVDDDVRLEDDWVPMDEQLNPHELEEVLRSKDAHSRAVVLETIGDIPDAEIKPPDNVLFVCKLNPVTEDEDLNTIFSRFGVVTSAEVIRDHKTGDSLCYAFIEFEDKDACEQAYFKMDNALIDDRRIHVDFSQSVAKLWSQYRSKKGQGGGGCFKCGSPDHIAKDCTGDATFNNSKYTLKDDNKQRGGDGNSRYDMVFEEDVGKSPKHSKPRRDTTKDHKSELQDDRRNTKLDYNDSKDRDGRRRDTQHRTSPYRGRERGRRDDRSDGRNIGDRVDKEYDRSDRRKTDDRVDKEYDRSDRRKTDDRVGKEYDRSDRRKTDDRVDKEYDRSDRRKTDDREEHKRRYIDDVDRKDQWVDKEYEKKRDERKGNDTKRRSGGDEDVDTDAYKRRRDERHSYNRSFRNDVRDRDDDGRSRRR